jgi:hypothetical protein
MWTWGSGVPEALRNRERERVGTNPPCRGQMTEDESEPADHGRQTTDGEPTKPDVRLWRETKEGAGWGQLDGQGLTPTLRHPLFRN